MGEGSEEIEVIHSWSAPRTLSTSLMCYFSQRKDIEVLCEPLYAKFLQVTGVDRLYKEEIRSGMRLYTFCTLFSSSTKKATTRFRRNVSVRHRKPRQHHRRRRQQHRYQQA
ncbi:hypothetical protein K7X08_028709 [Anisodus acutangulus]|uniref:Uncharacterized protein n=1 Tax=Anisodus acutangulus TaxID=402998 RepID=A0A9Q1QT24_9SOLA|nr:hypothetical protein K7X08_028709 [Anisodus acutangulus]